MVKHIKKKIMAYKMNKKSPCRVEGIMAGESVMSEASPEPTPEARPPWKSCNGFYKKGQCYRDRAAYKATKRLLKKKKKGK
jgi:hypothetical protein